MRGRLRHSLVRSPPLTAAPASPPLPAAMDPEAIGRMPSEICRPRRLLAMRRGNADDDNLSDASYFGVMTDFSPTGIQTRTAKFGLGAVVRHRIYPFRGVVFDVDPIFDNTEEWWLAIPRGGPAAQGPAVLPPSRRERGKRVRGLCLRTEPHSRHVRRGPAPCRDSGGVRSGIRTAPTAFGALTRTESRTGPHIAEPPHRRCA